jgi:Zn ribbon nucleic-acid-binding protein
MANDADWWAKKLATTPATRPAPSVPVYPGAVQQPVAPQVGAHPLLPGQLAAAQQAPPQQFYSYDANTGAQIADDGHVAVLYESALQTGGTKKRLEANGVCPECNGTNFFAQTHDENGMAYRSGPKSPQCFDCGFPIVQAGSRTGALAGSSSGKGQRPRQARQLPEGHDVSVVLEGNVPMTFPGARR